MRRRRRIVHVRGPRAVLAGSRGRSTTRRPAPPRRRGDREAAPGPAAPSPRLLVLFLHAGLERLDALGEIAHDARQLPGTEQNEDNGQDHDPVHQAEGTHCDDPGRLTEAYSSKRFRRIARHGGVMPRIATRSCRIPESQARWTQPEHADDLFPAAASRPLAAPHHRPKPGSIRRIAAAARHAAEHETPWSRDLAQMVTSDFDEAPAVERDARAGAAARRAERSRCCAAARSSPSGAIRRRST